VLEIGEPFARVQQRGSPAVRCEPERSNDIIQALEHHTQIEEEVFYPAVREIGTKKSTDMSAKGGMFPMRSAGSDRSAARSSPRRWPARRLPERRQRREVVMNLILLIVLLMLVIGALPTWPYSAGWGYYPSGGLGLLLLIVIILALTR
jgi:hypothetical protein